ncbi:MAG: nitrate reductase subunit alpha, partial [Actinomycetes bacterium]
MSIVPPPSPGLDDEVTESLLKLRRFFRKSEVSDDLRTLHQIGGRDADSFYRDRWSHDKVVRSTHGVNCTGSCSWKVYVKDGIITWEAQQTDYPSVGPDRPEYEPRGCPRGAAFSWYTYSPTRVRYPYVRGLLLEMYREAKVRTGDPVLAWADIVSDPVRAKRYKAARGKGGLVRATWDEAVEMVAAAHVHTIKEYGPDRIAGFSPIPAMSMVSHAAGSRFYSLIGGAMLSFYDWYADLPVASPQVFGDQTDVPESGDWWDAGYLIMWGSNIPVTRTPDAHWMTEARYRCQKVVAVAPDYADNVKFADEWLAPAPGTDGALAMAMGHVTLKEFFVDRVTPYFDAYVKRYTDLPFLVSLERRGDTCVPGKFLTASDLGDTSEHADFKTVLLDTDSGKPVVPNGSLGFRFGDEGVGKWNLDLGDTVPLLSAYGPGPDGTAESVSLELPRFDAPDGSADVVHRGVPVRHVGDHLVTTVYDLLLATYGVSREGLPGLWPTGYDDATQPCTPAWQEGITGVPAKKAERIGREFAANAEESRGRSMIIMGAGTNHWFHSDTIYRSFLTLTTLTGCQGVNGGGWAHYVGQEKVRPVTGYQQLANALDWSRPPRHMIQTAYWYLHTDQFRYDAFGADTVASASADGQLAGKTTADILAQSARMGWMPSYPTFDRSSLQLADDAQAAGLPVGEYVPAELKAGRLRFASENPDAPENFPRVLTVWRANLLGSSGKGNEYFLKHLLGTDSSLRATEAPPEARPNDVVWHDEAPTGKLDLLLSLDFRMTSTTLFSDVVLPAATWYEKHDLSTTDMHPFVNSFNPAIAPPWQTRTDFDAFATIGKTFSALAAKHLGVRKDVVAVPLTHDTPDEMANPHGRVLDWKAGECEPIPGRTMPTLVVVDRDYAAVAEKMGALGPLLDTLGATTKGVTFTVEKQIEYLRHKNGTVRGGVADGRPSLARDVHACEAILALSGTTNGHLAVQGFRSLEKRTGQRLADLAEEHEGKQVTFADTQAAPVTVITSPEWSGSESGGRR